MQLCVFCSKYVCIVCPIFDVYMFSSITWRPFCVGIHDDVIKWKHFPRYWPFVRGIRRHTGEFPSQRPVTRNLGVCLICAWINHWVNNREAGDLRRHRAHFDVIVKEWVLQTSISYRTSLDYQLQTQSGTGIDMSYYVISTQVLWKPSLTHLPLDKMAAISQTIFSDAFS